MEKANPDPNLPHFSVSDDDDDNDNDNDDNNNNNNDDDDDDNNCDVDGPTVQAHVNLAKTACKDLQNSILLKYTYLYLQHTKCTLNTSLKLNLTSLISFRN